MGAHELSVLLWRERELLDLLIFKLEEEQLLLTAGSSKWLHHGTREVELAVERVRSAGLARSVEAAAVAREWGLNETATLRDLTAGAPADSPWSEILQSHLVALTAQTSQVKQLKDANELYMRTALRSTQETMVGLDTESGTYDAHGHAGTTTNAQLFDQKL